MRKRCTLPRKSESRTGMPLVLSECRFGGDRNTTLDQGQVVAGNLDLSPH
jgi:hypothetical protein